MPPIFGGIKVFGSFIDFFQNEFCYHFKKDYRNSNIKIDCCRCPGVTSSIDSRLYLNVQLQFKMVHFVDYPGNIELESTSTRSFQHLMFCSSFLIYEVATTTAETIKRKETRCRDGLEFLNNLHQFDSTAIQPITV